MNWKTASIALALAAAFFGIAADARADEGGGHSDDYGQLVGRKLGRGASNTAFGWVELPTGIHDIGEKHGVGAAMTWGVIHGTGRTVQRTAVGIFELLTFPFGVPKDFEPMIEPEFVLSEHRNEVN